MLGDSPTQDISQSSLDALTDDNLCLYVAVAGRPPESHPLPDEGTIVLGRNLGPLVRVSDTTISRVHCTLHVRKPPLILVNHSKNGTVVGNRRLKTDESEPVHLGEPIVLSASVTAWVQPRNARTRPWQVYSYTYVVERLATECARAELEAADRKPFGVVRLYCDHVPEPVVNVVLSEQTFATDVVAAYAPPREFALLLVDTAPADVRARAQRIAERLRDYDGEVRVGVACFPEDSSNGDELLARASTTLRREFEPQWSPMLFPSRGPMAEVVERVDRIASAPPSLPIVLEGETGVGKRMLAQRLHCLSPRANGPFMTLDVSALEESQIERELFGYGRGAVPGTFGPRAGLLQQASGGTLYLVQIDEMPPHLLGKVLDAVADGEVRPIGHEGPPVPIDVRLVCATRSDLKAERDAGRFRAELFFRLGRLISIPPLRQRTDEIEPLARRFVSEASREARMPEPVLSREAIELLRRSAWQGNVRQLKNTIQSASWDSRDGVIRAEDIEDCDEPIEDHRASAPPGKPAVETLEVNSKLRDSVEDVQRQKIIEALAKCGNNQRAAAEMLDVARGTLINLMKKFGLFVPRKRRRTPAEGTPSQPTEPGELLDR